MAAHDSALGSDMESNSPDDASYGSDASADVDNPASPPHWMMAESELDQDERRAFAKVASRERAEHRQALVTTASQTRANDSAKIIDKARRYQQELFERAQQENVISVLDTGMGKTLIAAMLIRHILEQQILAEAAGATKKHIFFLANR